MLLKRALLLEDGIGSWSGEDTFGFWDMFFFMRRMPLAPGSRFVILKPWARRTGYRPIQGHDALLQSPPPVCGTRESVVETSFTVERHGMRDDCSNGGGEGSAVVLHLPDCSARTRLLRLPCRSHESLVRQPCLTATSHVMQSFGERVDAAFRWHGIVLDNERGRHRLLVHVLLFEDATGSWGLLYVSRTPEAPSAHFFV